MWREIGELVRQADRPLHLADAIKFLGITDPAHASHHLKRATRAGVVRKISWVGGDGVDVASRTTDHAIGGGKYAEIFACSDIGLIAMLVGFRQNRQCCLPSLMGGGRTKHQEGMARSTLKQEAKTMKASLTVLSVGILLMPCPLAQANFYGADDFNDNSKDASLWGTDMGAPGATLTETGQAVYLTGTAQVGEDNWRGWPWIRNTGSQTEDWAAQLEVNIPNISLGASHGVGLGMTVMNSGDMMGDFADLHLRYSESYGSGRDFVGAVDVDAVADPSPVLAATSSTNAAVRFRWDAGDTTLYMEYDSDAAANGFSWTVLRSDDLASGATDWNMGTSDTFLLAIWGELEAIGEAMNPFTVSLGDEVKMDNFNVVPEPSTLTLAALGLLGLAFFVWRRCRKATCLALLLVAALSATAAQTAVTIDTAPVGNTGNDDDTEGDGYGAVDYTYNIGSYEVTAGQYCEFLNAVAATDTYGLYDPSMEISSSYGCQITRQGSSGSYTYDFSSRPSGEESDWVDRPVNYVSWGDTARFTNWLHNGQPAGAQDLTTTEDGAYFLDGAISNADLLAVTREDDWQWAIPTEDEWYKAAYHKDDGDTGNYFDYATSSNSTPNNDLVEPTDPGNNATFNDSGYTVGSPYWRTEFGAHENSQSPYGTFDQGGNVWEWNEAILSGSFRGIRGGSFNGTVNGLHASYRYNTNPTDEYNLLGFRVVSIPEPGNTTLLLAAAFSLSAYAWRWNRIGHPAPSYPTSPPPRRFDRSPSPCRIARR